MTTELILERVVPVPPEAVWRAWTDPELLKQWFCPLPWRTVEAELDLRPGGIFRTVMQGPAGERHDHAGCYLEVDAPHRLVWTNTLLPGYAPATLDPAVPAFTCILTLQAVEGGTRYTARAIHRDAAGAQAHADMGFHEGWGAALTQLVDAVKGHVAES
jgi:uncharacterized protein YndB with AHSA1/START domain